MVSILNIFIHKKDKWQGDRTSHYIHCSVQNIGKSGQEQQKYEGHNNRRGGIQNLAIHR